MVSSTRTIFTGDAPTNLGKLIYEVSIFFYMRVPDDFSPVSYSFTEDGSKEHLRWVSVNDDITIYPDFFRGELQHPVNTVKHFVTDERGVSNKESYSDRQSWSGKKHIFKKTSG